VVEAATYDAEGLYCHTEGYCWGDALSSLRFPAFDVIISLFSEKKITQENNLDAQHFFKESSEKKQPRR
jgi:hypothetical protein